MKFKDGKKEYSIDFEEIHNRHNAVVQASFTLNVTKPFNVKNKFTESDVKTLRGTKGINFYKSSKIAKAVNAKEDVLFSLTPEALKFIEAEAEKGKDIIKEAAESKKVENWVWALGGDTHNLYISTDDLDSLEMHFRDDLKEIRNFIENNQRKVMNFLLGYSSKIERDTALYTPDGWNQISNHDLIDVYNRLKAEDKEKETQKNDKKDAIFAEAASTGERQTLRRWSEECNDPREECSIDNVIQYAMPDGTTKTERYHTW